MNNSLAAMRPELVREWSDKNLTLVMCVMPTAVMQLNSRIKKQKLKEHLP